MTVNNSLIQSLESFSWNEVSDNDAFPIQLDDFNKLINEMYNKIISTSQLKPTLENMFNKQFTLVEACCLIVQDQDKKLSKSTGALIQEASKDEKIILNHAFKQLSEGFTQVDPENLKKITLLFGIRKVHELASAEKIVPPVLQNTSEIQELENTINKLQTLRDKYDIDSVSEDEKAFLRQVDQKIIEARQRLEALLLAEAI